MEHMTPPPLNIAHWTATLSNAAGGGEGSVVNKAWDNGCIPLFIACQMELASFAGGLQMECMMKAAAPGRT